MKKIVYLILALFAIGCSQSNEDKIKLAFNEYRKKNFDDPSKFKEVVSIDSLDTISTLFFKERAKDMFEIRKKSFEYCDSVDNIINSFITDKKNITYLRRVNGIRQLIWDRWEIAKIAVDVYNSNLTFQTAEECLNQILSKQDTIIFKHNLSYRINTDDGLKLETIYVYTDSLYKRIEFKKEKMRVIDVEIIKDISIFEDEYGPLFRLFELKHDNCRKILSLLKSEFGELK